MCQWRLMTGHFPLFFIFFTGNRRWSHGGCRKRGQAVNQTEEVRKPFVTAIKVTIRIITHMTSRLVDKLSFLAVNGTTKKLINKMHNITHTL